MIQGLILSFRDCFDFCYGRSCRFPQRKNNGKPGPAGGIAESVEINENVILSSSVNATKQRAGIRKQERKRVGFNRFALLEALAGQIKGVCESDVRSRVIQRGRIGWPGRM